MRVTWMLLTVIQRYASPVFCTSRTVPPLSPTFRWFHTVNMATHPSTRPPAGPALHCPVRAVSIPLWGAKPKCLPAQSNGDRRTVRKRERERERERDTTADIAQAGTQPTDGAAAAALRTRRSPATSASSCGNSSSSSSKNDDNEKQRKRRRNA
jgi:hypothetical protein